MSKATDAQESIERWLPLNAMDFLVLAVLLDGDRHGYGIVKDIAAHTGGKVKVRPGNLYRVVDRLMERGFVEARERKAAEPSHGPRRHFGVTKLGRKVAAAHAALFSDVVKASEELKTASGFL